MGKPWKLKRTAQCKACPWLVGADPHAIPNGYSVRKHLALADTIADPDNPASTLGKPTLRIMACHESPKAHCIGWLVNQSGPGNHVALRIALSDCTNRNQVRLRGPQHPTFEDTLPKDARMPNKTKPAPAPAKGRRTGYVSPAMQVALMLSERPDMSNVGAAQLAGVSPHGLRKARRLAGLDHKPQRPGGVLIEPPAPPPKRRRRNG